MLKVASFVSVAVLTISFAGTAYAQQGMGHMQGGQMMNAEHPERMQQKMQGGGMGHMHGDGMGQMMNAEHRERMQQHKMMMMGWMAAQSRQKERLRARDCAARYGNPKAGAGQRGTCS